MISLSENSVEGMSQVAYLDEAVAEVFSMMMNVGCRPVSSSRQTGVAAVTAVVGLAGSLSGTFVLKMPESVARRLAELLTGAEMKETNSTVKDALGEVCNMLAGGWKSKTPNLAAYCMLSVPMIVSGTDYHVYTQEAPVHLERCFEFEGECFCVAIRCDNCAAL